MAFGLLDKLYDLQYFDPIANETTSIINCNFWLRPWLAGIKKTNKNGDVIDAGLKWSRYPNKHIWWMIKEYSDTLDSAIKYYKRLQDDKINKIINHLASTDPYFAVGYSKNTCNKSISFQFEVDFDFDIITNDNYMDFINAELLFEIRKIMDVHILLSGNRSIYAVFFSEKPIKRSTWEMFYSKIRRHLIHSGKNDIHTFVGSGIRLPLSNHQKTGGLCKFVGCNSISDVIQYLESINPNKITDEDIIDWCNNLNSKYDSPFVEIGNKNVIQSLDQKERRKISRVAGIKFSSDISIFQSHIDALSTHQVFDDVFDADYYPIEDVIDNYENNTNDTEDLYLLSNSLPSLHTSHPSSPPIILTVTQNGVTGYTKDSRESVYCANSSHKEEYESIISNGIPYGLSTVYLITSDFVLYCWNKYPDDNTAKKELERIISIGVDDSDVLESRKQKLYYMISYIKNTIKQVRLLTGRGKPFREIYNTIDLPEDYQEILDNYISLSAKCHKSFNRHLYINALDYILKKLFWYKSSAVGIGTEEIKNHLGLSDRKQAARIIDYFTTRYRVMYMCQDYQFNSIGSGNQTRRYCPSEDKPCKIKSNKEIMRSKKIAENWLSIKGDK
jgi:hypothetical protein